MDAGKTDCLFASLDYILQQQFYINTYDSEHNGQGTPTGTEGMYNALWGDSSSGADTSNYSPFINSVMRTYNMTAQYGSGTELSGVLSQSIANAPNRQITYAALGTYVSGSYVDSNGATQSLYHTVDIQTVKVVDGQEIAEYYDPQNNNYSTLPINSFSATVSIYSNGE